MKRMPGVVRDESTIIEENDEDKENVEIPVHP